MKANMRSIIAAGVAAMVLGVHAQTETQSLTNLRQGGVDIAWSKGITGRGAVIGILDNGFDLTHQDFTGRIVGTKNLLTNGAVTWGTHGTGMASVAAAAKNNLGALGVAPDAKLLFGQIGTGGTNSVLNETAMYRGLDWLSGQGATVINLSFGASYDSGFVGSVYRNPQTGIYFSASQYGANYGTGNNILGFYKTATDRGSILVAAAGNQGLPYSEFPGMYASRTDFANRLILGGRMIVVGAVDSANQIAAFSNRAGHLCQNSVGGVCRDSYLTRDFFVVAPGVNVTVSQPNQLTGSRNTATTMSGTSPAAAYVSGGIALMKQAWPQLRPEQLVNLVLTTTRDLGSPGTDNTYGRGLVDFGRAVLPQGSLALAAKNLTMPSASLTATSGSMTAGLTQIFRSTSVLPNAQVLDSYGRNYTANLGQAIIPNRLITYSPDSPWLGFAGYTSSVWKIDQDLNLKVMSANSGAAAQIERAWQNHTVSWQVGSQQEGAGFLGNSGSGALGLGSSATMWTQIGYEHAVSDQVSVIAQYGQGTTQVQNSTMSMIDVLGPIQSRSWRLGLNRNHNFQHNDRVGISLASPVSIRSGQARVSGVVGFDYEDDADGNVNLVPIIGSEVVSLRSISKEYNLVLNYQHPLTQTGSVSYNLIQRYNAGGQPGLTDTFVGVNLSWINR